jgi:RNA polymerase sigma-70 factor (ECF subfamily)
VTTRAQAPPDESLMERYASGDAAAFEALFGRYHARAWGFFLRRTHSEERAADLYQELFLRLHRARASYDPRRPFAPWFFQIARRLLIDELRRIGHLDVTSLGGVLDRTGDPAPDPEGRLVSAESAGEVLARLTEIERHVIVSTKVEGREYAEVAGELGKSVDAVKKLASRALAKLRSGVRSGGRLPAAS